MAQNSDTDVFKYTWRIENFSMCPLRKDESIQSPSFVFDGLEKSTWYLELCPKGKSFTDGEYVLCYLRRAFKEDESDEVTIYCAIKIIPLHTKSHIVIHFKKFTFNKLIGSALTNLISHTSLKNYKNAYLPNDVLTVLCCLQRASETSENKSDAVLKNCFSFDNSTYAIEEISTLISEAKLSMKQRHDTYIFTTRIPVERRDIKWIIKNFKSQMQTMKKIPVSVVTKLRKKSAVLLNCYLSGDWDRDGIIRIDIQRKDKHFQPMLLKCKVSVLNQKGAAHKYLEDQHIFGEEYEVWSFPPFIKVRTIENPEYKLLNDFALTLQCEFLISYVGEKDLQINNIVRNGFTKDIGDLLNDEELTDATLISEGVELPVHKSVISARSPVFRAMFTNDTEEKRTGVVRINDIEADTLRDMKSFMYGNDFPDLQPDQAMKLYLAADKYQILMLRDWCAASLKYTLSVSNVCEVLVLADLHKDVKLLNYVHAFLLVNSLDVLESSEWKNLMDSNLKLAADTMRKIITQASSH